MVELMVALKVVTMVEMKDEKLAAKMVALKVVTLVALL
jgi:hypothetical protein